MVSIIMPVKNAGLFLSECIGSIIAQSFKNWELIAVDDYSDDNSLEILIEFSQNDSRIKVVKNKGKGITPALLTGYEQSIGEFITRMDADDIMPKNKLFLLREKLVQTGNDSLTTGFVKYFSEQDLGEGYKEYEKWLNNLCENQSHFKEMYKECVLPSPAWMTGRKHFDKIGGFNAKMYPEDYDLCFRFYKNNTKIQTVLETVHLWRDHVNRASRNDKNYADNSFLELKVNYFLDIEYVDTDNLVLWGAGKKGKKIAENLIDKNISFHWVCNNPNKIGKHIYNKKLLDSKEDVVAGFKTQLIVAVANKEDKKTIQKNIAKHQNLKVFWFC